MIYNTIGALSIININRKHNQIALPGANRVCVSSGCAPIFGTVLPVLKALEALRYTGISVDFCHLLSLTIANNNNNGTNKNKIEMRLYKE